MFNVLKKITAIAGLALAVDCGLNKSRQRSHEGLMTDNGEYLDPDFRDLACSLAEQVDSAAHGRLIVTPITSSAYQELMGIQNDEDAKTRHEANLVSMRDAFASVPLSKKGHFTPATSETALVKLFKDKSKRVTNDSIVAFWDSLKATTAKQALYVPVSGNRRDEAWVFANTIRVAQGLKPYTEIEVEVREYISAAALLKDIIRLNESTEVGRKHTSTEERVNSSFAAYDQGYGRSDLSKLFPDLNNGRIQQIWEHILFWIRLNYVEEHQDLAAEWRAFCEDPKKAVMTQPVVTKLRSEVRMKQEHTDGNVKNSDSFLGSGKKAEESRVRDHIEANPSVLDELAETVINLMDGKAPDTTRTKPMKRDDVLEAAARVSKGAFRDALTAIANGNKPELKKASDLIAKLVKPVRNYDAEGKLAGKPIVQKSFKVMCTEGIKPNKALVAAAKASA